MQYCEKCGVHVAGGRTRCPLCQAPLTGTPCPEEEIFPRLPTQGKKHQLLFRSLLFATISVSVICLAVNFMIPSRIWWSGFVIGGLASAWLLAVLALRLRHGIPKVILRLVMLGSLLALVWDWSTGNRGWAVGYVIPILCTAAMVALMVLPRLLRMQLADYMLYLFIDILFGILPTITYATGLLRTSLIPSLVCVVTSLISMTAVLVFQGKELCSELSRRMHL